MSLERALLILLVLGAASRGCWSCSIQGFEVTTAQPAANAALRLSNLYSLGDIDSHFKHMTNPKLVSNKGQSYTCVDARGDDDHLSSPGGDFSELVMATYTFFDQTGIQPNATSLNFIFRSFMDNVASPSRPFYFHTDDTRLQALFKAVGDEGVKPVPVVLPAVAPSDPKQADIWYRSLVKSEFQGCGHVRLMLANPEAYGMSSAFIPGELLRQFFAYWWPTPEGSPQRQRVMFSVKKGPLVGKAIAVVVNDGPGCKDTTPAVVASYRGSSVFVFHQAAVSDFRAQVLAPFFANIAANAKFWGRAIRFDMADFTRHVEALFGKQLTYTVSNLPPANGVTMFKVAYKVK